MSVQASEMIRRLQKCGYTKETAADICRRYLTEQDFDGLAMFVRRSELLTDDRKEYPEEA